MEENKVKFGLRKITTTQFATIDSVEIDVQSIKLNFGFGFGINEANRLLGCAAKFEFLSNGMPFIVLSLTCDFEIESETWDSFIHTDSNTIVFPLSMVTHLAVLAVGTARGVLHAKTENTKYNQYFLPTINVTDNIKEDIVIALGLDVN